MCTYMWLILALTIAFQILLSIILYKNTVLFFYTLKKEQ